MNSEKKALFPWPTVSGGWHKPGNPVSDMIDAQVMRLQHLSDELQKVYSETYDRQVEALSQTSERLTQSMQELMSSQGTAEVLTAESHMASAWLDGFAARSQHWLALSQKLQECYTDFARASFEDIRKQSEELAAEAGEAVATVEAEADINKQFKAVKSNAKHAA